MIGRMAIREILKMGDPRLLRVAQAVTAFDTDDLHQLVRDLVDTMRAADGAGFPDQALFHELKQSGQLASPADAAARVLAFLARPDFGTEPVADVRS